MRWRVIAWVSLGVNGVLAALWLLTTHHPARSHAASGAGAADGGAEAATGTTNLVVRRQLFSWQEVESADYPTYIANLRSIGCPEQTIRDIIIADVNALYARRKATEIVSPSQQWWRTAPDANVLSAALAKTRALDDERRALLVHLLGPDWEMGDLATLPRPSHPGVTLDGPVLGTMSVDSKQAVEEVNARSQDRLQAYLEQQRSLGKDPDPAELAKLRQDTRNDLEKVLTPSQLEEFLLRYSQQANDLRAEFGTLQYFNPTADEFRAVFRATDALDQQIQMLTGDDPNTVLQRNSLEEARDNAIKVALGPQRYDEYVALEDPVYRQAFAQAQAAGTPDAVQAIYEIDLAAQSEQQAIASDTNLTDAQKKIQLQQLQLDQLKANTVATGQELPPDAQSQQQQQPQPRKLVVLGPGESASTIALMYGLPVSALSAANPNLNLNDLKPGDSVVIPRPVLPPIVGPNAPLPPPLPPPVPPGQP